MCALWRAVCVCCHPCVHCDCAQAQSMCECTLLLSQACVTALQVCLFWALLIHPVLCTRVCLVHETLNMKTCACALWTRCVHCSAHNSGSAHCRHPLGIPRVRLKIWQWMMHVALGSGDLGVKHVCTVSGNSCAQCNVLSMWHECAFVFDMRQSNCDTCMSSVAGVTFCGMVSRLQELFSEAWSICRMLHLMLDSEWHHC